MSIALVVCLEISLRLLSGQIYQKAADVFTCPCIKSSFCSVGHMSSIALEE